LPSINCALTARLYRDRVDAEGSDAARFVEAVPATTRAGGSTPLLALLPSQLPATARSRPRAALRRRAVRRRRTARSSYEALAAAFDPPPLEPPLDPPEPPLDPLEPPEPPEPLLDPPPLDPADPPDDDAPELESLESLDLLDESLDLLDESLDLLDESLLDELSAFALASAGFSGFDDA
jgi:hypothetical protein